MSAPIGATASATIPPASATVPPTSEQSSVRASPARTARARTAPRTDPEARILHAVPIAREPDQDKPDQGEPGQGEPAGLADSAPAVRPLDAAQAAPAPPQQDPTALCCSIVLAAVEALRGVRPLAQLNRWLAPDVYEALSRRREVTLASATVRSTRPARIRRARMTRVAPNATETTVIVEDITRVRAAAVRMEHHRGSWRVVVLELG